MRPDTPYRLRLLRNPSLTPILALAISACGGKSTRQLAGLGAPSASEALPLGRAKSAGDLSPLLAFALAACGGGGGGSSSSEPPRIAGGNNNGNDDPPPPVEPEPQNSEAAIHENHPLNKPVYEVEGEGTFKLRGADKQHFTVDADGRVWWKEIPDYENPKDRGKDNVYDIAVAHTASDGVVSKTQLSIAVNNIDIESSLPLGATVDTNKINPRPFFFIKPTDFTEAQKPSEYARHLLGNEVWKMPKTGPLLLTWSIDIAGSPALEEQADIERFRAHIRRVLDEFEAAANLKFVEVTHGTTIGDFYFTVYNQGLGEGSSTKAAKGGIVLDNDFINDAETDGPTRALTTHEIGHMLGLTHPFHPEKGWPGNSDYTYAAGSEDSIMSYYYVLGGGSRDTGLQAADIEALQWLYGAPNTDFAGVENRLANPPPPPVTSQNAEAAIHENHPLNKPVYNMLGNYHLAPRTDHHGYFLTSDGRLLLTTFSDAIGTRSQFELTVVHVLNGEETRTTHALTRPSRADLIEAHNNPETVLFDFRPDELGTFELTPDYKDNVFFNVDENGRVWWKKLADYEDPKDKGKDNIYDIEVTHTASDGVITKTQIAVTVQDIQRELTFATQNDFDPVYKYNYQSGPNKVKDLIPEAHSYTHLLLDGHAFFMPEKGPFEITWSIAGKDSPKSFSLAYDGTERVAFSNANAVSDDKLASYRAMFERAFAEYEKIINVKFIEVPDTAESIGMIRVGVEEGSGGAAYTYTDDRGVGVASISIGILALDNFYIYLHELGHVMGFSYPFPGVGSGIGTSSRDEQSSLKSIMTYGWRGEEGYLTQNDINALQFLYGAPGTDFDGLEKHFETPPEIY